MYNLSVCAVNNEIIAALKKGSVVNLFRKNGLPHWERLKILKEYSDKTLPVVEACEDGVKLLGSWHYRPMIKDIQNDRTVILNSPFLKRGTISGRSVRLGDFRILPVAGVPYGCKMVSPVVFVSEDDLNQWRFCSFLAISEDVGFELRKLKLTMNGEKIVALCESFFPFRFIFYFESYDGKKWKGPQLTNIEGNLVEVCHVHGEDFAITEEGKHVVLWRKVREDVWEKVKLVEIPEKDAVDAVTQADRILLVFTSGQKISSVYMY
ncbi:hypothetical protein TST_1370 [Thermosulfidibacter takaii ABI70S6]|uniref:Uncharacterized protein n=1 Tax=Thermosulfidibacter takaii (strain DSM 17441 / JCM 13301 / NBRC 103674 / ABI70S6) TaxID=1298851 RepID=A0A0S3QUY2_THET7|nr:hypothetical protein [Thermosulfidibacter takaii]BAT72157.1 hypothetical protein TST_1370 [Thermosulfidibacter takaii ABI70S6]